MEWDDGMILNAAKYHPQGIYESGEGANSGFDDSGVLIFKRGISFTSCL